MKEDEEVVRAAISQNPLALKFALGGLSQNRELMILCGLDFQVSLGQDMGCRDQWIVQSVKFGLYAEASDFSTKTHKRLHANASLGRYRLHNPSAFNKGFCAMNLDGS